MSADDEADAQAARAEWGGDGGHFTLRLAGDWRGHGAALPAPPAGAAQGALTLDAGGLAHWDAGLAAALWQRLSALDARHARAAIEGLPAGLRSILALALPEAERAPAVDAPQGRRPSWLNRLGQRASASAAEARRTLEFVGEVLIAGGHLLRGRSDMRWSDLAWQLDRVGPRSVPIVALVSGLVGLITAYMGAAQLERFGAQAYVADLVTVGVVREIAALMTGIILAGRVGAAFAAQLGSMRANEEIDALRTLGLDPVGHLVLPRVLAMLLVAPLLTAFGALVGSAAGWLVAVAIYGISPQEYVLKGVQSLTLAHVSIGLFKGTVYALLVALAGCRQGLAAGRSAQAVGDATTAAVVQAIVWIVAAASLLTIVFQRLDW